MMLCGTICFFCHLLYARWSRDQCALNPEGSWGATSRDANVDRWLVMVRICRGKPPVPSKEGLIIAAVNKHHVEEAEVGSSTLRLSRAIFGSAGAFFDVLRPKLGIYSQEHPERPEYMGFF